ncbi:hypothetical protein [Streptococcus pluranimalium]|uniref:hypothetical protein n=1 Tax=Streptococcus pluranimalium TaxID=82348 RepID=UPI004046B95A
MKNKKFIAGLLVVFLVFLVAGKYTQSKSMLNSNYVYATTVKDKKTGKEYRYEVELLDDKKAKVTKTDLDSGKQTTFEEVYQGKPKERIRLMADKGTNIELAPPAMPWTETEIVVINQSYTQVTEKAVKTTTVTHNQSQPKQTAETTVEKSDDSSEKTEDKKQTNESSSTKKEDTETKTSSSEKGDADKSNASGVDIAGIAKGDLSSIAGSFEGENGKTPFIFNADGTGKINNVDVTFSDFAQKDGVATFKEKTFPGVFTVVPAGMATPENMNDLMILSKYDDETKDRIFVSGEGSNIILLSDSKSGDNQKDQKETSETSVEETKVKDEPVDFKVTDTNNLTLDSAQKIATAFGDWLEESDYAKDSVLVQSKFDETYNKSNTYPQFLQFTTEDGPAIAYLYGETSGEIADIPKTVIDGKDSDGSSLDDSRNDFDITLLGNDLSSSQVEDFQSAASFRIYTLTKPEKHRFNSMADEQSELVDGSLSDSDKIAALDYGFVPFYEKNVDHNKESYQIALASNGKVYYVTDYRLTGGVADEYTLAPSDMQKAYQDLLEKFGEEKEEAEKTEESSSTSSSTESETEISDGIFPPELIGTWINTNSDDFDVKLEIDEDGTVTKYYENDGDQTVYTSKVSKIEKVSDTKYRFVDYDTTDAISPTGMGGAGFEVETGFVFDGTTFSFAQWTRDMGAEFDPESDKFTELSTFEKE